MKTALFPGTFDPPTLGHIDIIQRSTKVCDQLCVGISTNSTKTPTLFSLQEREVMLKEVCAPFAHVRVETFETLTVDFAKKNSIDFLLRGLRAFCDFGFETQMAVVNRRLGDLETVFLMADERFSHISSTLIRELGRFKSRLHGFVPAAIEDQIFRRISGGL